MNELGHASTIIPTNLCDNLSATNYTTNSIFHSRMKHVAIDFHYVHEKVQGCTLFVHISGVDQLANALTKPPFTTSVSLI